MFEKFWQDNLKEIQENKLRFIAVFVSFVLAVGLFFSNDSGGDEIILEETPPVEPAENLDDTKIIAVHNAATSSANSNIKVVVGANSGDLYVHDPFQVPPKEIVEPIPEVVPPVEQVAAPAEKFVLRGVAIIGQNKSALVQKISDENKNSAVDLILEIGDLLNGKKIVEIAPDSVILEGGEILFLDIQD